ncbi:MAG: hypothetical protein H6741_32325 [Alphaproteobacteria bacterium]|nr:hypothetical protein [Alphaproteobacteria bacterium]
MSYHYIREPGEEGSILTVESEQAAGANLTTLLERERPPLRAGLEIASAIADILTIAEEDGALHGDVKPGEVWVDATGSVALAGYGVPRRTTRAPESHPQGMPTDVFGLGVLLHALLSDEPLGRMPTDPDGHDQAVVDRVMRMDFSEVEGRRWLDDVRSFLCKILAYHPEDRPQPLDAANVLAQVASQCPGRTLEAWAARAVPAAGGAAPPRRPAGPVTEDLGGPQALSAPVLQGLGGFQPQRTAPSSKGESTAFWSKDRIAAMLAEEDDESEELLPPPVDRTRQARQLDTDGRPRPAAAPPEQLGGPSPAGFGGGLPPAQPSWGQAAPAASPWGNPAPPAPPPPLAELPAQDSPSEAFFKSGDAMGQEPEPPPAWEPQAPQRYSPPPQGPPPPMQAPPPQAGTPFAISGPTPDEVAANEPDIPRPGSGGGGKGKMVAIIAVVLILGCMGLSGAGGALWYFTQGPGAAPADETPSDVVDEPREIEEDPPEPRDSATPEAPPVEPPPEEPPPKADPPKTSGSSTGSSTKSSGGTTKSSGGSTGSSTKSSSPPKKDPPATTPTTPSSSEGSALASGQSEVRISFGSNADKVSLTCGDGQKRTFNGSTAMSFTGTVTCRVKQGKNMGVFTVTKSGAVTCSEDSRGINCSGP